MHEYSFIGQKKKNLTVIFFPMLPLKILHYLLFVIFYQVYIITIYITSASRVQYFSEFHLLFNNEKLCIWDDGRIQRLVENNWCNKTSQEINATQALSRLLVKKVMRI